MLSRSLNVVAVDQVVHGEACPALVHVHVRGFVARRQTALKAPLWTGAASTTMPSIQNKNKEKDKDEEEDKNEGNKDNDEANNDKEEDDDGDGEEDDGEEDDNKEKDKEEDERWSSFYLRVFKYRHNLLVSVPPFVLRSNERHMVSSSDYNFCRWRRTRRRTRVRGRERGGGQGQGQGRQ